MFIYNCIQKSEKTCDSRNFRKKIRRQPFASYQFFNAMWDSSVINTIFLVEYLFIEFILLNWLNTAASESFLSNEPPKHPPLHTTTKYHSNADKSKQLGGNQIAMELGKVSKRGN